MTAFQKQAAIILALIFCVFISNTFFTNIKRFSKNENAYGEVSMETMSSPKHNEGGPNDVKDFNRSQILHLIQKHKSKRSASSSLCADRESLEDLESIYNRNICSKTLTMYSKKDCRLATLNLQITDWPKVEQNCFFCKVPANFTYPSRPLVQNISTVVLVWNQSDNNGRWMKIKITPAQVCTSPQSQ